MPDESTHGTLPRATTAALCVGLLLAAFAVYAVLGDPAAAGAERQALSDELLSGVDSEATAPGGRAYAELEQHLRRRPADGRAQVIKARLDMRAQRFDAAAQAYRQALDGPSKARLDAALWVEYAEAVAMTQGGTLIGAAQVPIERALAIDPSHPQALDLAGSAAWEARDFARASQHWRLLLAQLEPGSARHAALDAAIERAGRNARLALPPRR